MRRLVAAALSISVACAPSPAPCPTIAKTVTPPPKSEIAFDASASIVLVAPPELMAADRAALIKPREIEEETDRRRVRDSVTDLERVLGAISGAKVRVETSPSSAIPSEYAILVGRFGQEAFGAPRAHDLANQGFRVVVSDRRAALYGESDLATSYAIYELAHRIGCRWYFPGELGEVLPPRGPIKLAIGDESRVPSTLYRGVWYADDAWKRRNRTGGLFLNTGHALDHYFTPGERKAHPEWHAVVGGKPDPSRMRWSPPGVAEHIAKRLLENAAAGPGITYSLGVEDGDTFDESEDRALDAGDIDPTTGKVSVTDRFLVLANRVASRVTKERPDLLFGFLAYASMTRLPLREKLHPSLVPQIAPISYSRAHPMNDDAVPHNAELRATVDGWSKLASAFSYYAYAYNLAEPVGPNPMLHKWGYDVPYVLARGCKYWQPETFPNFETSMHALVMATRLAFDARERPEDVYREIDQRLYGAAGAAMSAYWKYVDDIWTQTPEYSGGKAGQPRRFPPERLAKMHELLAAAARRASTPEEHRRVGRAEDSLALFDELMKMRRSWAEGQFADLDARAVRFRKHGEDLALAGKESSSFGWVRWAPSGVYVKYFDDFDLPGFAEAAEIARTSTVERVFRSLRWEKASRPDLGPEKAGFDDSSWRETDVAFDTWSKLGLHDHFGPVWYRSHFSSKKSPRAHLWLGGVDGRARVFVNGKEARFVPTKTAPMKAESAGGPILFDISGLLADGDNVVAIQTTRITLNELGVGGLMGPVVLHHPK